jgi:glycosyltransferase involved in cell wall biosynthesis
VSKYKELTEKYKGKRIILHVASYLSPMKGTEYAIEAMGYINKEFPDALLLIITSSNDIRRQEQLFGLARLNHANIEFVKNVKDEDMPAYYSLAEVLLSPSLDENIHLPVLEAAACECPTVFIKRSMQPEDIIYSEGGTGLYSTDSESMAFQSDYILRSKINRNEIGKNARQFVLDNFSWDKCVSEYERIIKEVVSV